VACPDAQPADDRRRHGGDVPVRRRAGDAGRRRGRDEVQADDTTLVVYRKDRYCPYSSRMPQSYEQQMRQIPGVAAVVPIKIVVSNCRTSLDVVTFRGVPREPFSSTCGHSRLSPAQSGSGSAAVTPPCWARRSRRGAG
jgi:hypothetical protein